VIDYVCRVEAVPLSLSSRATQNLRPNLRWIVGDNGVYTTIFGHDCGGMQLLKVFDVK
jgi:hypothetical protein